MTNNFFVKAAANLAENGNIEKKYTALYAKAMEILLAISINLITALLIGYFCGMWWHCIIFLAGFIPLRSYAGGYHARGYISCYFESCAVLMAAMFSIKYFVLERGQDVEIWQAFFVSVVVIFLLAPLADENKPISEKEAVVFKRRTRIILTAEIILIVIFTCFGWEYRYTLMASVFVSALALVLHKVKEFLSENRKQCDD